MSLADQIQAQVDLAETIVSDVDIFWLLFGSVLVFFMQTGFAMLEVGSVSIKNTKNILIKNILDASIGALVWWLVGYAFAYGGGDEDYFIGTTKFAMKGDDFDASQDTGGEYASWLFQWAFAATAATIVSGAIAERVTITAYVIYTVTITGIIYPVVVYNMWKGAPGFFTAFQDEPLEGCGVIDFAGSGVVHATGGIAAIIASYFTGPRIGRFVDGVPQQLPRQSAVLQTLGALILWFGWYGFNGVSTLAIVGFGFVASKTMVTTTIAAAAGAISLVFIGRLAEPVIDSSYANNGIISGLVAITASCSVVEPEAAFIIGVIGAAVYYMGEKILEKLEIDDVVGAAPAHGFVGFWGVIAAGVFATADNYSNAYYSDRAERCAGLIPSGNGTQLGVNLLFILFLIGWVGGTCTILFASLHYAGILRVSKDVEEQGLDNKKHGGIANTGFAS